jgi:hypothetical protein
MVDRSEDVRSSLSLKPLLRAGYGMMDNLRPCSDEGVTPELIEKYLYLSTPRPTFRGNPCP